MYHQPWSWLQCYAFDVIGAITFKKNFGFPDVGEDKAVIFNAIDQQGIYSTRVGIFSSLHPCLYQFLSKMGEPVYLTEVCRGKHYSIEKTSVVFNFSLNMK
jgi:hypothetical protein